MPLFRFRHFGANAVPQYCGLTEPDTESAFVARDAFFFRNPEEKYVVGSMEEFRVTMWHKVADPPSTRKSGSVCDQDIGHRPGFDTVMSGIPPLEA